MVYVPHITEHFDIVTPENCMKPAPILPGDDTWRFVRAGFMDGGSNAVWVDDIELSGGVPL